MYRIVVADDEEELRGESSETPDSQEETALEDVPEEEQ